MSAGDFKESLGVYMDRNGNKSATNTYSRNNVMAVTAVLNKYAKLLPENGKLYRFDAIAINVIVNNCKGGINSCDIPFTEDISKFVDAYNTLTAQTTAECKSSFLEDYMIVGTSAMVQTEIDCIVNQYTDKFCNPMVMWGKYRKGLFKTTLPISFQFHHVQMDGGHGAMFLELLQREISNCNLMSADRI